MTEWFERWFGSDYLELYQHRDETDAAQVVALLERSVPLTDKRVLDLACGSGRHADLFRKRASAVVGFDLSLPLLKRAREDYEPPLAAVRGDMRLLPFAESAFDVVVNLFTSFGYFDADDEHLSVVQEVARVLAKGGWFVLDFLNASHVADNLVSKEEMVVGGKRVAIVRHISDDGRFVFKEMDLRDEGKKYVERVRLFAPGDLEHILADAGFTIVGRFGDYRGGAIAADSPRAILISVRE